MKLIYVTFLKPAFPDLFVATFYQHHSLPKRSGLNRGWFQKRFAAQITHSVDLLPYLAPIPPCG